MRWKQKHTCKNDEALAIFGDWQGGEEEDEQEKGVYGEKEAENIKASRGCTIETARVYASHHRKWNDHELMKKAPRRFRPSRIYPEFVRSLIEDHELQENSAKAVVFENIRRHQLGSEVKWRVPKGKSIAYELQLTRQIISNICRNLAKEFQKAVPMTVKKFRALPLSLRKVLLLWINTGARLETISHLQYEDLTIVGQTSLIVKWRSLFLEWDKITGW